MRHKVAQKFEVILHSHIYKGQVKFFGVFRTFDAGVSYDYCRQPRQGISICLRST